jgi:hypothetical protein
VGIRSRSGAGPDRADPCRQFQFPIIHRSFDKVPKDLLLAQKHPIALSGQQGGHWAQVKEEASPGEARQNLAHIEVDISAAYREHSTYHAISSMILRYPTISNGNNEEEESTSRYRSQEKYAQCVVLSSLAPF